MLHRQEKIYQIALTMTKGLGSTGFRLLTEDFENVETIFQLSEDALKKYVSRSNSRNEIINKTHLKAAEAELAYCESRDIKVLYYKDPEFPQRLNFYDNLPGVLYYKGNSNLNDKKIVSIVGTREPSEYGKSFCEKMVKSLAKHNCLIVSGLAFGIDIASHKAALKNKLNTIGVVATGQENIYPGEHNSTAKKMVNQGGILTEFRHDEKVVPSMFAMRNRIVAAMSDAIIVVQSAKKGGSLITAEFGHEYNKKVFAVPGRPQDSMSSGCNMLIKRGKAFMYEDLADLETKMHWKKEKSAPEQASLFASLTEDEHQILNYIRHNEEVHVDDIHHYMKKPAGSLAATLLTMELDGHLRSIPGNRYMCG